MGVYGLLVTATLLSLGRNIKDTTTLQPSCLKQSYSFARYARGGKCPLINIPGVTASTSKHTRRKQTACAFCTYNNTSCTKRARILLHILIARMLAYRCRQIADVVRSHNILITINYYFPILISFTNISGLCLAQDERHPYTYGNSIVLTTSSEMGSGDTIFLNFGPIIDHDVAQVAIGFRGNSETSNPSVAFITCGTGSGFWNEVTIVNHKKQPKIWKINRYRDKIQVIYIYYLVSPHYLHI